MTWADLLAKKTVSAIPSTREELDNLRSIVARSMADVTAPPGFRQNVSVF